MNDVTLKVEKTVHKLAILDDDRYAAEAASWEVEEAGFEPVIVPGTYPEMAPLIDFMLENADGAICDHRLAPLGMASFHGASVVAALYEKSFPAILVTQFVMDVDVSIRKWRHKIPVLLSRDETNPESIRDGILTCSAELSGHQSPSRKPHRVLLEVMDVTQESNETVVDVLIPSWNTKRAVRMPASLISKDLHRQLISGYKLLASVNIGADQADALFFTNFEEASKPEVNDGLA